ncbi:hypothetical protein KFL_001180010 [Klebsormidium nitens]|uniref:CUE domain-containing protein n=1 Tax=Klebsormidium nitens TaxID=105231 RepID=A0A1Y1HXY9_KLENI|nr:hypothetical protein KFL_001180010 [Klebsormidium nitens]|eukprot:GAQ82622.1 hypothetical protein KFL_001180010 [Klebsormidium nitens]
MSAVVCGKRSFFEDSPADWSPPKASKRVRYGGSPAHRFPPSPPLTSGPEGGGTGAGPGGSVHDAVDQLRRHFPKMDTQVLVKVLQTCENNVDAAIQCLTQLRLSSQAEAAAPAPGPAEKGATHSTDVRGTTQESAARPASPPAAEAPACPSGVSPRAGAEWVELVVAEMAAAASMDDARARGAKVLGEFEALVRQRAESGAEAACRENAALKEHVAALSKDNHILKRAVQMLNARQQEAEERGKELAAARQALQQYQEQLRTLEVSNYALSLHLRKAQEQNSMPGRFHPDVF